MQNDPIVTLNGNNYKFSDLTFENKRDVLDAIENIIPLQLCSSCELAVQGYNIYRDQLGTWSSYHNETEHLDIGGNRIVFFDRSIDTDKNIPFPFNYPDKAYCNECVGKCDGHRSCGEDYECDEYVFFHNAKPNHPYGVDCYDAGYNLDCYEIRGSIGSNSDTLCMGCYEQIPNCGYCGEYFDDYSDMHETKETCCRLGMPSPNDVADLFFDIYHLSTNPHQEHFLGKLERAYEEYIQRVFHEEDDHQHCCYCHDELKPDERHTHLTLFIKQFFSELKEPFHQSLYACMKWEGDEYKVSVRYYDPKQMYITPIEPVEGYLATITKTG